VAEALKSERLVLRPFEPDDWPGLLALQSDPETCRYLTTEPYAEEDSRAYIGRDIAGRSEVPRRTFEFAVILPETDDFIGRCGLFIQDAEIGDAGFWYVLDRRWRGRGFAVEAARRLVDHAFLDLGLRRLSADIDPRNTASARVAERLGLRLEAHFLENVVIKGELCGTLIYAILRREWEARP
jgi:RimJ/RimL family protein N-acetyltransferase